MIKRFWQFLAQSWRNLPLSVKWLIMLAGVMALPLVASPLVFWNLTAVTYNRSGAILVGLLVLVGSLLVTVLLGALAGLVWARSVSQALQRVAAVAQALEKGGLKQPSGLGALSVIDSRSRYEVDRLMQAFHRMVLELRRLSEETTRLAEARARQLDAATEIAQATSSSLDLDIVLRKSIELIRERFGFYHVSVFIIDPKTNEPMLRQATGGAGYALIAHEYQLKIGSEALVDVAISTRAPRIVQDVMAMPGYVSNPLLPDTRAEAVLPLLVGNTVSGALEFKSTQINAFAPEIIGVLQGLAAQVAIAIQNTRLYEVEFSRRQLAETLQAVGRLLGSTLNLDEVLNRLLAQLALAVPYDRAAVMLHSGEVLRVEAVSGFASGAAALQASVEIQADDIFSQICRSRQALVSDDAEAWGGWRLMGWEPERPSWVGAPLIAQDEVIGMIAVGRERVGDYLSEEADIVYTFANQAALAIYNARLYDQVTRFNQQLEQKVRERTAELEQAYQRLEKMDRNKSDFINIAAHELRTPLTVLQGYTSLLRGDPHVKADHQLADIVAGMLNGSGRLHEIINSMLEAARIDSQALDLQLQPAHLGLLMQRVRGEFKAALVERNLTLVLRPEALSGWPTVAADAEMLYKVIYNVVINAIKYTPDGGTITLDHEIFQENGQQWVDLRVRDTGIGIAPDYQDVIFEKFYQTGQVAFHSSGKTKFKGGGPGLGLAIARGIVEAHRGRIWVESPGHDEEKCPGSCFHILLPATLPQPEQTALAAAGSDIKKG